MIIPCLLCALASQAAVTALDYDERRISYALRQEPPDLNTTSSTDAISGMILDHVMEGLLSYDPQGKLIAGVAERWELRDDGATFWLREDARWSDGTPVVAQDFVFAWRKVLEPATASTYGFILFPIRNARAVSEGELPSSALGVKAVDDRTLEVSFHQPCPYFLGLTAFRTLFPIKETFYHARNGRYGADAVDLLYNGPFVMTEWIHGASVAMVKNQHYWAKDRIWLNRIDIPYITEDTNARLNLYRDNKIALADELVAETLDGALQERMQVKTFLDGAMFYLEFNHRDDRISRNKNFRKAVQTIFNTDDLVYKVLGNPGTYPTYTFFPRWMQGVDDFFVREYPPQRPILNEEKARQYLETAKEELGLEQIPPIALLADDRPSTQKAAEYLQTLMQQKLGLEVRIDKQIFKQRLAKTQAGQFDVVITAWAADYNDLLSYGDLFQFANLNNRGRYNSSRYDELVTIAQSSLDVEKRMQSFAEMQQLLFEDVVIVPLYERGKIYVQHPRVKGVIRRAIGGDPNFNYVTIEPEQ
tara:strand:+ start:49776 stop:51371 length:1596 start_codon:yes stop_codon:yes gene_type:complete